MHPAPAPADEGCDDNDVPPASPNTSNPKTSCYQYHAQIHEQSNAFIQNKARRRISTGHRSTFGLRAMCEGISWEPLRADEEPKKCQCSGTNVRKTSAYTALHGIRSVRSNLLPASDPTGCCLPYFLPGHQCRYPLARLSTTAPESSAWSECAAGSHPGGAGSRRARAALRPEGSLGLH